MIVIDALYAGALTPLGPHGVQSGIRKTSMPAPWRVTATGLVGDHQGDLRRHGGSDKALHHYPREHYRAWMAEDPSLGSLLANPPSFGENVSTFGLTEKNVCIGDIYQVGGVKLQISQGRQPCWRVNTYFERADIAARIQQTGRTGWYYRVLQEGEIRRGDELKFCQRPRPEWPVFRALELLYHRTTDFNGLSEMSEIPELALSWRDLAARRCATRSVENWTSRIRGTTTVR